MSGEVALTGAVPALLIIAAVVAWPLTRLLLHRYRTSVVRAMHRTSDDGAKRGSHPAASTGDELVHDSRTAIANAVSGGDGARLTTLSRDAAPAILRRMTSARAALWRRYIVAGASQAAILTIATMVAGGLEFLPFRTLVVWLVYAWPIVVTIAILSGFERRVVAATVLCYFVVLLAAGTLGDNAAGGLQLWILLDLPPTVVIVFYLHRSVRAVGVVVLAFVFVGLVGAELVVSFVGAGDDRIGLVVTAASQLGVGGVGALVALVVVGFTVAGIAAWFALGRLGAAYRNKGLPDQLVIIGATWALFAADHGLPLAFEGLAWAGAGLVAFAAFWLAAERPMDGNAERSGPRLLMLRVFALGKRSERLFRRIATDWEHVGPIRLIGGPDLALATIEPDEFLVFAAGDLERLFIAAPEQLQLRSDEQTYARDRHSRHRVQEFFCFDDTWQPVVRHLMHETDLVLMDLRGFAHSNDGARHELTLLAQEGMVERTTFVVDRDTDLALIAAALREGGGDVADATVITLRDRERLAVGQLLDTLPGAS